jgi:hypothetical protein
MTFWLNKRTSPFARLQGGGSRIYRPRRLRANFFARLGSVQSVSRFMIEALQHVHVYIQLDCISRGRIGLCWGDALLGACTTSN